MCTSISTLTENTYHVRLVNPHAEGYCSTNNFDLSSVPLFLDAASLTGRQASMVMSTFYLVLLPQELGSVRTFILRETIHNARHVHETLFQELTQLHLGSSRLANHHVVEVVSVKAPLKYQSVWDRSMSLGIFNLWSMKPTAPITCAVWVRMLRISYTLARLHKQETEFALKCNGGYFTSNRKSIIQQ